MSKPDIAVIISSFNRFPLLIQALDALYSWIPNSTYKDRIAIVVYDEGSKDGSLKWLTEKAIEGIIPIDIITPATHKVTNFSAGLNIAASFADNKFPFLKYLLFYETDNQILSEKPLTDALTKLQHRDNLAACGFTVRKYNGRQAGVGMPFPSLLNFALGQNIVDYFQLEAIPYKWETDADGVYFSKLDVVFTSPLLIKLTAWKESGGMDESVFPFADCDIDWAHRMRILHWQMGIVRTDIVIHDNQGILSGWAELRALQFHRARLRYFRRYKPNLVFIIWPFILLTRHSLELLVTKCIVHEPTRRRQLSEQFLTLLKSCIKGYEL